MSDQLMKSLILAAMLGLSVFPAAAQTTHGGWPSNESRWGLSVFRSEKGAIYHATGPVLFFHTQEACQKAADAATSMIENADPHCDAMACKPHTFSTCVELTQGATGRISQWER